MKLQFDPCRGQAAQAIFSWILMQNTEVSSAFSLETLEELFTEPPDGKMGDLAFPCFPVAKLLKKNPAMVAKEFIDFCGLQPSQSQKFQVTSAGPYLNFTFAPSFLGSSVCEFHLRGGCTPGRFVRNMPKTMIEYSQPNTHKELHVGHLRNACLGDAIVRLKRFAGFDILTATFPGDVGTHVAKCLWYLVNVYKGEMPTQRKGEWLGGIYTKAHLMIEDTQDASQKEKIRAELTGILKELHGKSGSYFELWKETRQWSIEQMESVYQWCGIQFDQWYWESEVDEASVAYVKKLFEQGVLQESQSAIGMDLSDVNLGFCLLLKSDGTGLYATKDLELARRKFENFDIQRNVYIVDMRQALHFQQVFKVLERIGFSQAKNCFHYQYNFVELPDGAMSSRKGNIVPLSKLIDAMEHEVRSNFLSKYTGLWDAEEITLVARQVAQGAIKYGMLRMDANKKIVFDLKEWLRTDGESGPFIQYSAARVKSLLRKFSWDLTTASPISWDLLVHPLERQVLQQLSRYQWCVASVSFCERPAVLCTYLFQLAQAFNSFYHELSIGQAESQELKEARLGLSATVGSVLQQGLGLLGIPTPERM